MNAITLALSLALITTPCHSVSLEDVSDRACDTVIPFSTNHSLYNITEDIDLKGKTIELPDGATIDFRGGHIMNGKLICHNTVFSGRNGLTGSVILAGSVLGPLDISVFELKSDDRSFDIGSILNKAGEVCKSIIVPEGKYYLQTPVCLKDIRRYLQYGDLIYNGKSKDVTVIQFLNAFAATISIDGKVAYDIETKVINYTKSRRTNIVGLEFANINNSSISVSDVEYFNNNIRVSAYGAGNCYNKYSINLSVFSNEHLRIFQKNKPANQIGWCNENIFIGGRFCNWSHFDWNKCESVAIRIEGAETGDTYNSANSLLFIKPCMEGFKGCAIYAKNVTGCHWQDARTEDTKQFIKFVGDCRYNEANALYGTEVVDYTECTTYPFKMIGLQPLYSTTDSKKHTFEIYTKDAKVFKVIFNNANAKGRVWIQYMTDLSGHVVSKDNQRKLMRPRSATYPYSYYYSNDTNHWVLGADVADTEFVIPEEVTKIRVILTGDFSGFTVYSDKSTVINER